MRLLGAAARFPLRLIPRTSIVGVLSGALRGARWIVGSGTHGCWIGTYERDSQSVFSECVRAGSVVFDIGANVGFFSLLAARLAGPEGHVYAFEPVPRNLDFLVRHVTMNHAGNVTILPIAVSSRHGEVRFGTAKSPSMGSISDSGDLTVRTEAVDALLADGTLRPPTFMKIDVEGAEYEVLTGSADTLRRYAPTIFLSTHGFVQQEKCWDLLSQSGYQLKLLRDGTADGNYLVLAIRKSGVSAD